MTLNDIFNLVMKRLDEDPEDFSEYEELFRSYVNIGYQIAIREFYKPRETIMLITDCDGIAPIDGYHIIRIVSLCDEDRRPVRYSLSEDGLYICTREKEKALTALCEVERPPLIQGTDEPQLPKYVHTALADYICYQHLSSGNLGKQAKAQFYRQSFYEKMQALRPQGTGSVTGYRNLYAATGL